MMGFNATLIGKTTRDITKAQKKNERKRIKHKPYIIELLHSYEDEDPHLLQAYSQTI